MTDGCLKHFIISEGDYIMGVGSVTSANNMSSIHMTRASSADVKSKKIQDEITDLQQQMQKVSSKEDLSADEKANERKKQQQEISSLNTELKRHQEDILRTQKRERMLAELQKDKETADYQGTVIFKNNDGAVILKEEMNQDEERGVDTDKKQTEEKKEEGIAEKETKPIDGDKDVDKDTGLSNKEIHEIVSADASAQQVSNQAAAIAKIKGGITVLKGEIKQDERHGINTDKKQAELEKLEKKEERVSEIYQAKKPAANMKVSGIQNKKEDKAIINASKLFEENQASQQRVYVSLGN